MRNSKKFKISALILSFILVLGIFAGCTNKTKTMKDRAGNDFNVPKKMDRIISTAPSNTEILVALGLGDKIIATDKYSKDIEGVNKDATTLDFLHPDAEKIVSLKPDIIIASTHNKAGGSDPFKAIKDAKIPVVYIKSSENIEGIYGDIEFLAKLTNTEDKGKELVSNMKKEIDSIKKVGDKIKNKKTVYFEIGSSPSLYSFGEGTFLNEMINIIGAKNIFSSDKGWISPSAESVIEKNPDVILTNVNYIKDPVKKIEERKGWNTIKAVKNKAVYQIDTNSSSRPSQHIIKALKEMAKDIYPNEYKNF